jgi:hypothetical protein
MTQRIIPSENTVMDGILLGPQLNAAVRPGRNLNATPIKHGMVNVTGVSQFPRSAKLVLIIPAGSQEIHAAVGRMNQLNATFGRVSVRGVSKTKVF